jgi:hypothetical protein
LAVRHLRQGKHYHASVYCGHNFQFCFSASASAIPSSAIFITTCRIFFHPISVCMPCFFYFFFIIFTFLTFTCSCFRKHRRILLISAESVNTMCALRVRLILKRKFVIRISFFRNKKREISEIFFFCFVFFSSSSYSFFLAGDVECPYVPGSLQ